MGKVKAKAVLDNYDDVFKYLVKNGNEPADAALYASAFVEYREAEANIRKNGAITANPRTGAPLENPFLKVRDRASQRLERLNDRIDSTGLWD